jgi:hypothetical protein
MKVQFYDLDGLIGTAGLRDDGSLHVDNEGVRRMLEGTNIVEPGTMELLTPDLGERYLRALPATFRGVYLQASLVED